VQPATGSACGDRRHDAAGGEQLGRAVLVFPVDVDDDAPLEADRRERGKEPAREGVGVDGERHRRERLGRAVEVQGRCGIRLQQRDLARQADEHLARVGGPHRLAAFDEHPAELLFERLDALADGGRGDVEFARGRVEGARVDDGAERGELFAIEVHLKRC